MRLETALEIKAKATTTDMPLPNATVLRDAARSSAGFRLMRYRVSNFRSVTDSGWLTIEAVTALIGVNESGKTNLLLPLWKLNPAGGGELQPTSDYPKSLFATIRNAPDQFQFITAEFDTGSEAAALAELAGIPQDKARRISVARLYDGSYQLGLPDFHRDTGEAVGRALTALRATSERLSALSDTDHAAVEARQAIGKMLEDLDGQIDITGNDMRLARNAVAALIPEEPPAVSQVIPQLRALQKVMGEAMAEMIAPDPAGRDDLRAAVIARLPRFVYYSNYGNLDSEIYLPHVVENMGRSDIGAKESAKARTLQVLFDFVGVQAQEILELGRDFRDLRDEAEARMIARDGKAGLVRSLWARARSHETAPDPEALSKIAEAKRTRSILLQSAGTKLTRHFGEWWKQGDYRFRFEADGNHFRIWVADARRPQEVELEHRSTGLQWFLSFFLVFLHEAKGAHDNCVLLLDEPGHSLHPLAQRDLSAFLDGLSETNQIVYTTHSPFLVDADRLAWARKVFVDRDGSTRVSGDLMDSEGSDTHKGASFAVRAALNMAVAEVGMGGAQPVLVPGRVEQIYLSVMRTLCIASGGFSPRRDIIFAPACDAQGMPMMVRLLGNGQARPPRLLIDDTVDEPAIEALGSAGQRAIRIAPLAGLPKATIEDLFPRDLLGTMLDRVERRPERLFADRVLNGHTFLAEAIDWARSEHIDLEPNWRVHLAERMRMQLLDQDHSKVPEPIMTRWIGLMQALDAD